MNKILYETPVDPSRLNLLLPPGVDWVVQKALSKAPEDRFNNAREFREALFNAIPDELTDAGSNRSDGVGDSSRHSGVLSSARKLRTLARANDSASPLTDSTVSGFAALGEFSTTQSARPRVLFVDDEERILTALKTIFRSRYHVLTAANGQEALDFVGKFKIPVIVSDQRMPGMQGVELLRRARELSPDSVRILLTGYSDLASIVGSINEGEVYRFISKPWDNQDLQLIISEAVEIGQHMIDRKGGAAQPVTMGAAVMVLDQRPGVFDALRRLLGATHELVYAATIDQALLQLEQREIGVLVADIDTEIENYLILFNQLKQKYPQILVIVLTSASDSEMVIHLINEAQIYRFLNKPVNLGLMQQHLSGAIGRYAEYQSSPELLERHKVKGSEKAQASAFGRGLVERLKSLRNVFAMQAK